MNSKCICIPDSDECILRWETYKMIKRQAHSEAIKDDIKKESAEGQQTADFISCVAFGKIGQFIEKYGRQGVKLAIEGRIQTGSYTNREGQSVYTTDIVVESAEFAESKQAAESNNAGQRKEPAAAENGGFMPIESSTDDLPFT